MNNEVTPAKSNEVTSLVDRMAQLRQKAAHAPETWTPEPGEALIGVLMVNHSTSYPSKCIRCIRSVSVGWIQLKATLDVACSVVVSIVSIPTQEFLYFLSPTGGIRIHRIQRIHFVSRPRVCRA